jgi:hypothetical protein
MLDFLLIKKTKQFDHRIIARAYALGYLTTTTPRLLSFVRILLKQEVSNRDKARLVSHLITPPHEVIILG